MGWRERAGRPRARKATSVAALTALLATTLVTFGAAPAAAAGTITGTVFRDFNTNGRMDTAGGAGVAIDTGVAGVTVRGYDSVGALVGTATSGAAGTYSLGIAGEASALIRVEFSGFPAGYEPSVKGTGGTGVLGGTTVQFVTRTSTGVNLGIQVPEEHSQSNPPLVTPIQRAGVRTDSAVRDLPVLTSLPWSSGYTNPNGQTVGTFPNRTTLATTSQVGSVWGTAYQAATNSLYAAATLKRHSGMGPLGIGGIYRVTGVVGSDGNVATSGVAVSPWLNVQGKAIVGGGTVDVGSVGTDASRGITTPTTPALDLEGFQKAGKVGIGGVAVSTDEKTLYFVNLYDRNLYSIDISDPVAAASNPVIRKYTLGLSGGQRPWALTIYRDQLYVGYVDSGEALATPTSASAAGLRMHLIRANESSPTVWSSDLLNASLGYTKGTPTSGGSPSPTTNLTRWNTWTDNWSWTGPGSPTVALTWYSDPAQIFPQPILSGLQFDDAGYLTLALADRTGIQGGNRNFASNSTSANYYQPASSGDLLMAAPSGGVFAIESNGSVGTRGPSATAGNNEGPGGGEFYQDANSLGAGTFHKEVGIGSVAHVFGIDEIAAVTYDPLATVQVAGDNWFRPSTGQVLRGYTHTLEGSASAARSPDGTFQKGGGLGDLETLSVLAPTEIGNRVWLDANRDGLQGAGESGINGVTVELLNSSNAVVGTAVTSGGGEYYFSTTITEAAAGTGDNRGGGLALNGAFTIRVGKAADYVGAGPLAGLLLTTRDATMGADAYVGQSDALDSDAVSGVGAMGSAWFPLIAVASTETAPGEINHTFDAGFFEPESRDLALVKTLSNAAPALGGNGGTVTFTLTVSNQGTSGEDVDGITLTDYIDTRYFAALGAAPPPGTTSGAHAYPYTWSIASGGATATKPQVTIAGVLAPGESLTVPLTLTIAIGNVDGIGGVGDAADVAAAFASGLINDAEISLFDTDGVASNGDSSTGAVYDRDSVPNATNGDTFVTDDDTSGTAYVNTSGTPAGYDAGEDEDDHDRAIVPLWDLALIKERASGQDAHIESAPPSTVNFDITVKNQGGATAHLVHVQDTVGTGLALGTNATQVVTSSDSNSRTITYLGAGEFVVDRLDAGESVVFAVATTVAAATQNTLVNTAEITQFDDDSNAGNGLPAWVVDFDSTPDANAANDDLDESGAVFPIDSHNAIDNAPLHGVNALDEDDHDSEGVSFALMRIGSTVYIDGNGNLVGDGTGEGVAGVLVQLRNSSGTVVAWASTDANGDYFFEGLYPGDYTVGIPSDQSTATIPSALGGYETVPGAVTNPETLNFDNDGEPTSGWLALTDDITLTYGSEPSDQVDDGTRADVAVGAYPDRASNLNIDFVFQQKLYEVGNTVWIDANDDGTYQSGESVLAGVDLELWSDIDGDGLFEPTGDDSTGFVGIETTDGGGNYHFSDLVAGEYFVHIDAGQPELNGLGTGAVTTADADDDVDNDNNGVLDAANGGWTSGQFELGEGDGEQEQTGELDAGVTTAEDGTPADERANQTVDFAFVERVRIGNQVWRDESDANPATDGAGDNNGTFDAGNGEVGLTGVTVALWQDDGDGTFEPTTDDTFVADTVTDGEGNYWFENVVPGRDYFVAILSIPSGFATARSSSGQSANPLAGDNNDDGAAAAGYLSVSRAFTATAGGAPTGEVDSFPNEDAEAEANAAGSTYDDNDSNLRIDLGFVDVPLYRIGNLVWFENTPDGTANAMDAGLEGVLVQLVNGGGTVIAETATDSDGYYAFENLVAGDYRVRIPGNQTELLGGGLTLTAGVLNGLAATVQAGNPDPDANPADNDHNGVVNVNNWESPYATLGAAFDNPFATEPTTEVHRAGGDDDTGWANGPDSRSEFTVDFGFYPILRIGDTVWLDDGGTPYSAANEDDGEYDATETPLENVDVTLYTDDGDGVFEPGTGDSLVATTTTDAQGEYFFFVYDAVSYWVAIPATQVTDAVVLDGLRSSTGQALNDLANDHDQGAPLTGFAAVSNVVVMSYGAMSNGDTADEANANTKTGEIIADASSNLAIDFGFSPAPQYAIGNLVWKDLDNDGVADLGEEGFAGVTVRLYRDNGDNNFTPGGDGPAVGTTTTDADGRYLFENLAAGTYFVMVPAQATINDWFPAGTPDGTADNDEDNDNNGAPDAYSGYTSGPVVLGNGNDHAEPTLEADGTTGDDAETPVSIRDDRSNQTVDFAFHPGLRLGNLVWHDESDASLATVAAGDNDGRVDAGESVMPGVTVLLFLDGGDATFDGGYGDDTAMGSTLTDSEGNYWFEHLAPGSYWAAILSLPGSFGAMQSSDGRNAGGAALDNNDNGVAAYDGVADDYIAVSDLIALAVGTESTGEGDGLPASDGPAEAEANAATEPLLDADSELTVDFGFILSPLYRVGNLVWRDLDRDGIAENGEPGVAGVLVQLLDNTDAVIAEAVTDASGKYAFENLDAGSYRVRIPHTQTQVLGGALVIDATALDNLVSTTDAGTPETDIDDNDDNGVLSAPDWVSGPVTLGAATGPYGTEPATETLRGDLATDDDSGWANGTDAHSNFTVDFGFYPGLRLGDTVWLDNGGSPYVAANEDNGILDATEPTIPGVDVRLYVDDGDGLFEPGTDDTLLHSTETDLSGEYFFTGLDESASYWVAIPDAAGQGGVELDNLRSSTGQSADGAGTNDRDHGAPASGYLGVSPTITLVRGSMAYGDAADEANANTKTGFTLGDGDSNLVVDFGFSPVPTYEIGNLVWLDDDDGIAESGETGIPGITVQLFFDDGDGVFEPGGGEDDGIPSATTTTDGDGVYHFSGLPAGAYWVLIPDQPGLDGLVSSLVRETDAGGDVDNDNNGIEFSFASAIGWAASLITVGEGNDHEEPTGETDDTTGDSAEDGSPRDDRANQTVDFGFSPRLRLGNQVWRDESDGSLATNPATDNNGVFDAGSGEVGIGGVTVELWFDANGDGFEGPASDDGLLDATTTDPEGNYWFDGIVPGANYYVAIPSVGAPFSTARSSAGQSVTPKTADNDDDGAPLAGYLSVSEAISLTVGGENTGEADAVPAENAETEANLSNGVTYPDANSNLHVDFGFIEVPLYRIGNRVWLDADNDGVADVGEAGIGGVWVQLLNAGGTVIGETVTDSGGYYAFENLVAGDYRVVIPTDQGLYAGSDVAYDASALDNLASSTADVANADGDVDNDDNGVTDASDWRSGLVTLGAGPDAPVGTEPTNEVTRALSGVDDDAGWAGGPDARSNFSVDFGFYELLRLGNWVWLDDGGTPYVSAFEDNGAFDASASEAGIPGVDLNLYADDGDGVFEPGAGDVLVGSTTTDSHGHYYFTGLTEGPYWVAVPASQTELTGLRSSTNQAANDLTDSLDQGEPGAGLASVSHLILMDAGALVTGEGAWEALANVETGFSVADASSQLTIDFGFSPMPEYALGNLVWEDYDNDGAADFGEPGVSGLTVDLYADDGDGVLDAGDGAAIASDVTDSDGRYLFEGLDAGDYVVHVPAQAGLTGWASSGTPVAGADGDIDNDNNGVVDAANGGWTSGAVSLGEGDDHSEPTGETDTTTGDGAETPVSVRDDRSNQTVDFGFWRGLRLGNQVWLDEGAGDHENNGVYDADETPITGVDVELWLDGGDAAFDAGSGDDVLVDTTSTDGSGHYYFEHLAAGGYWVAIPSISGGGVLSSTNTTGPSLALDGEDDGAPGGSYLSVSPLYVLAIGGAETGETDGPGVTLDDAEAAANAATSPYRDGDSFLTVDFGFINVPLYRLGNLVWFDHNDNGIANSGEPGIPGVIVNLHDGTTNAFLGTTTTGAGGKYLFDNLAGGGYYVVIPKDQSAGTNALDGFLASSVSALTTDADVDNDSDATDGGSYWASGVVMLGGSNPDSEPTDEIIRADNVIDDDAGQATARIDDDRSNFSVDFGFYSLSLGNHVFEDLNNNGTYEPGLGEAGIDGVTVELRQGASLVATQVTSGGGLYLFTGLTDGSTYTVVLPQANFSSTGALNGYWSSTGDAGDADSVTTDGLDRGIDLAAWAYGAIVSEPVTVNAGGEPINDGVSPNPDNDAVRPTANENLVLDFGFVRLELGGNVFHDFGNATGALNNNGLDDGDGYFAGVTLLLTHGDLAPYLREDGSQATATTDLYGNYVFTGLPEGTYIVGIPDSNFSGTQPLRNLGSSDGNDVSPNVAPSPDNDLSGEDNGNPVTGDLFHVGHVHSGVVTLAAAVEPSGDTSPSAGTPHSNSNRTVDFGFWIVQDLLELGNQIWFDTNEDGVYDRGVESPAPGGVRLELWDATTDTVFDVTFTDSAGQYLFAGLPTGDYYLVLSASNFAAGGPLFGYFATTGGGVSMNPDDGADDDSNGTDDADGVRSGVLSLVAAMPTLEPEGYYTVSDDRLSDLTLDVGLIEIVLAETGTDVEKAIRWVAWFLGAGLLLILAGWKVRRTED